MERPALATPAANAALNMVGVALLPHTVVRAVNPPLVSAVGCHLRALPSRSLYPRPKPLQLPVHNLQFLVRRLQFLVDNLQLRVPSLQLPVTNLQLPMHSLQLPAHRLRRQVVQRTLQLLMVLAARPWEKAVGDQDSVAVSGDGVEQGFSGVVLVVKLDLAIVFETDDQELRAFLLAFLFG